MFSNKLYHPPHIFQNNTIYFITARTIDQKPYFNQDFKKELFRLCLKEGLQKFSVSLYAWVILENHYHLLLKIQKRQDLARFINFLNGKSSFALNKLENQQGRKIWYQYWDRCIRNEIDFWKHFNYIHHNPIKHGLYKTQEDMFSYPFSSMQQWVKIKGKDWVQNCFELHPIVDFTAAE